MKKKIWIFLPMFILLLLSGCSCSHKWTQADCLNAQICTKCEAIGEAALGHDWSAAVCDQPETCSRCGETQGTALGHSFGDWTFDEAQMSHICAACGFTETSELDRSIQLETLLPGLWEFYGLYQEDSLYYAYSLRSPGDSLIFGINRSVSGTIDASPFTGTWEFLEYAEENENRLYFFRANGEDGRSIRMMYKSAPDDDSLYCFYANDIQTILTRNDETAAAIAGTWGAEANGIMYSLTLKEDRTVIGNLGEEFEGTWQVLPVMVTNYTYDFIQNYQYCGIYIRYFINGEEQLLNATVTSCISNSEDAASGQFIPETITITHNDTRLTFTPMTQQQIDVQSKSMEESPNLLIGTWSSMYYRSFGANAISDMSALDYTVTFLSDGTFTASVGKAINGTWEYDDFRSGETWESHYFYFYVQGERSPCKITLECSESHVPKLTIVGSSSTLYLNKRTSRQDQALRALIGTWTSEYDERRAPDSSEFDRSYTMDYSLTFHEDGTFTGYDGTELKGTWVYETTMDETVHQYNLFINGDSQNRSSITMYDHSQSGDDTVIDYRPFSSESGYHIISLIQYTPEDLEIARMGPTHILGEWSSKEGNNSITFHEDGTFTANLDTTLQGYWSFRRYKSCSAYWYNFTYPGQNQYCDKTIYIHTDDDRMTFRIEIGEKEAFYEMYRSK